jgi:peptidoglycan/LPS O-acetylase OafA/YrhL
MRIYYRSGSVLVTERVFKVSGRPPWQLAEFADMYVVNFRGIEYSRWTARRLWPTALAVLACAVVAVDGMVGGGGAPLLVPAAVLAACAVIVLLGGRTTESISELWAITDAGHICLFRSRDKRMFDQVRRAVVRAREYGQT